MIIDTIIFLICTLVFYTIMYSAFVLGYWIEDKKTDKDSTYWKCYKECLRMTFRRKKK